MTEPTTLRKPLWRRILKWTLRIATVLLVLLVVVWSIWNFSASRSLRNEIAKIRAAGQPLTFADLSASLPKVDRAHDAGPFYSAALAPIDRADGDELYKLGKTLDTLIDERTTPPAEFIATAEGLLEYNNSALEMLDRASAKPGCSYQIGIEHGSSFYVSRATSAKGFALIVSLRTGFLALQGQSDQAVDSAISSLRMLRIFDRQPILICHLVKMACLSLVTDDILAILEFSQPSEQALADLEDAMLQAEQSLDLKRVALAERVYTIATLRNVFSHKQALEMELLFQPPILEQWPSNIVTQPLLRTWASKVLRMHSQLIEAADNDFPQLLDAIKALDNQDAPTWNFLANILMSSMEPVTVMHGRSLAQIRSARLAIIIERYRRAHGQLPKSLADLPTPDSQQLPLDPFTGQNLIYRSTDSGYTVYSLGQDRQDNGGPSLECVPYDQPADHGLRVRLFKPSTKPNP